MIVSIRALQSILLYSRARSPVDHHLGLWERPVRGVSALGVLFILALSSW